MASVDDLMAFINSSPSRVGYWSNSEWENELSRAVPEWRSMVADPQNWDAVGGVTPLAAAGPLFKALVDAGGMGLAKRWFHSYVSYQRGAAQEWLTLYAAIDVSLWCALDRSMKDHLLEHRFDRFPGEPFKMLGEYRREIRHIMHRIDLADLADAIHSLPYIVGYVPSPQIEKLRSVIQDADDQKYLSRINEMISRREEACKSASFQQQHRIPYTLNGNERELVARVMEITRRNGYLPAALPPIFISHEPPPIFTSYPELETADGFRIPRNPERGRPEIISIEESLGVYLPQQQQIVIYERGIRWHSQRMNDFDREWILSVVLIHEIGHWITHVLPKPGVPTWPTDLYILAEKDLRDGWAQLITWWIANQLEGPFRSVFEILNQRQSNTYRVFEQLQNEPIDRVMASLERLRLLPWPARLQDWLEILG